MPIFFETFRSHQITFTWNVSRCSKYKHKGYLGVAAIEPAKQAKTCRRKKQDSKLNLAKVSVNETLVNSLVPDEIQAPLDEPEDSSIMAHVSVGGAKKIKAKNRIGRPPMSSTIRNQSAIQMSIDAALERYNLYKNSPQKLVHVSLYLRSNIQRVCFSCIIN